MQLSKIFALTITSFAISSGAFANPIHTWHTVSSLAGEWNAKLQMINEGGIFVAPSSAALNVFEISPNHSQDYGFGFDAGDDFDVAYTLTLTEKSSSIRFSSKACVYVITASGPAKPDVRVSNFNGAKCDWKIVPGRGEDFTVST